MKECEYPSSDSFSLSLSQISMSAGTGTANIAVLMFPAPSLVSVNLVSSWQETIDLASVSDHYVVAAALLNAARCTATLQSIFLLEEILHFRVCLQVLVSMTACVKNIAESRQ